MGDSGSLIVGLSIVYTRIKLIEYDPAMATI